MKNATATKALESIPDPGKQQQRAADPGVSAWVDASAGSGKTTVLTQRVTRLLLEGARPERILCLTFTRAAAAEMANRVTAKLAEWTVCSDNDLAAAIGEMQGKPPKPEQITQARRLFARALSCPGGMRIRTIHAFAQEILRRFPIEAGLSPHFAVIEENDAAALQEDVLKEFLRSIENAHDARASAFGTLVENLGEFGFREAMRSLLHDRAHLSESAAKEGGLDKQILRLRTALGLKPQEAEQSILAAALSDTVLPRAEMLQAAAWLEQGTKTCKDDALSLRNWLALPQAERAETFEDYWRCLLTKDGNPYKDYGTKGLREGYPDLDPILRREAERIQQVLARLEVARIATVTEAALAVGTELARLYDARKAAQAALDYDDLIIYAERLLQRPGIAPWVLYKLDGGIDHILVDEAQDTSRAQWNIVRALAEEFFAGSGARGDVNRTLFAVGDEKQSIFSFQHADPGAFAEMRSIFAHKIAAADKPWVEAPLRVSFRSAPAILNAVDAVFARDIARAGVSVDEVKHFTAAPRKDDPPKLGRVEVEAPIPAPKTDKNSGESWLLPLGYEEEHDPQAELAARIADKIRNWLAAKEILPGRGAPIAPGDIMILLRRRGRFADLMVRALKQRGVPVTGVDRMHLIRQLPVMDVLALLQFALLPEDDLTLAALLKSPLIDFGEDDLMALAIGRKGSLWHALAAKTQAKPIFAAAHDYLSGWLGAADFMTPFAMLTHILNRPCPGHAVSGRRALWSRLGPDALDPLDELLNAAQDFSRRHAPSLQAFLHWLTASDSEIKRELDRGGGQVRIMTVHAAKGLEAPIVFLPDTMGMPRPQDVSGLLRTADGLPLYVSRKPSAGIARRAWDEARRKQLEEYRRLLYVALTRAINRLYVGGWEPKRKEADGEGCWHNLIHDALMPLHQPAMLEETQTQPDIVIADPVPAKAKTKPQEIKSAARAPLPDWAKTPAPEEKTLATVAPSHLALPPATATPDSAFARGRIIHRLLQSLPDLEPARRANAAAQFLNQPQHRLAKDQQESIKIEVLRLFEEYPSLFGPESRAEVPVAGIVGGRKIAGQIDRLCLREDSVWIVDYKTNRPPPQNPADIPLAYREQLRSYRAVLRAIYPGKPVRAFLLWTYGPQLMEISEELGAS